MPSVIACPSCSGQLRLPDDFIGQQVRCPTCSHVFTAAANPPPVPDPPPPAPRPEPLPSPPPRSLDNGNGNGNGHEPESTARPRGLVGAVELKLSLDEEETGRREPPRAPVPPSRSPLPPLDRGRRDEPEPDMGACPACGKHINRAAPRCTECGWRMDEKSLPRPARRWDRDVDRSDDERSRYYSESSRRDRVPSRGVMILVLGIISLLCIVLPAIGVVLGLIAWLMGQGDLNRMKANEMDPDGGLTRGGWICGILGTLLSTAMTLTCLGSCSAILLQNNSRPPTTYNQQIQYKDSGPKDKDMKKQGPPPIPQQAPPAGEKDKNQDQF